MQGLVQSGQSCRSAMFGWNKMRLPGAVSQSIIVYCVTFIIICSYIYIEICNVQFGCVTSLYGIVFSLNLCLRLVMPLQPRAGQSGVFLSVRFFIGLGFLLFLLNWFFYQFLLVTGLIYFKLLKKQYINAFYKQRSQNILRLQ